MQMTENEIVRSFLESADKRKQIKILSELNACSEQKIVEVLEGDGRVKTNMLHGWKISNAMREKHAQRNEERREKEMQLLAEAEHKKAMDQLSDIRSEDAAEERCKKAYSKMVKVYAEMWGLKTEDVKRIGEDLRILREMAYAAKEHGSRDGV